MGDRFKLIEEKSFKKGSKRSERELFSSDSLEEIAEFVNTKAGVAFEQNGDNEDEVVEFDLSSPLYDGDNQ